MRAPRLSVALAATLLFAAAAAAPREARADEPPPRNAEAASTAAARAWTFEPDEVVVALHHGALAGLRARVIDDWGLLDGRCRPYACVEGASLERRNSVESAAVVANVAVGACVIAFAAGFYALTAGRSDPFGTVTGLLASGGTATF